MGRLGAGDARRGAVAARRARSRRAFSRCPRPPGAPARRRPAPAARAARRRGRGRPPRASARSTSPLCTSARRTPTAARGPRPASTRPGSCSSPTPRSGWRSRAWPTTSAAPARPWPGPTCSPATSCASTTAPATSVTSASTPATTASCTPRTPAPSSATTRSPSPTTPRGSRAAGACRATCVARSGEHVPMGEGATTGTVELLERSAELDALDGHLAAVRAQGRGRLVLIAGEAGIGKTALVRAFCERARPRPGPVGRVRRALHAAPARPARGHRRRGGRRARRRRGRGRRRRRARSRRSTRSLRGRPPGVVVLEDLHWADEATLDVLRLLARRIESLPALVLATYRDDELDPRHPLRIVLGELPSGVGGAARAGAAVAPRRWPRSPASARASTTPSCTAGPPATRSS